jgi:hypothetical protein
MWAHTDRPGKTTAEHLDIWLDIDEKQVFEEVADLAGLACSARVREPPWRASRMYLVESGQPIPFSIRQTVTGYSRCIMKVCKPLPLEIAS